MDTVSSYAAGIEKAGRKLFCETERIYRDSVLFSVYDTEWGVLSQIKKSNKRSHAAEYLVHTKKNTAMYDFDVRFPKMPSYLRRAAARAAPGAVSGCRSNLKNRIGAGRKGRPPKLTCDRHLMPVFCRDNMYKPGNEPDTVSSNCTKTVTRSGLRCGFATPACSIRGISGTSEKEG